MLTNTVRVMLRDSGLAGSLWGEAYMSAAYVHNRMPMNILKGLTPFKMHYGTEPDLAHFRAFSTLCSMVDPLAKLKKLDDCARMCFFVGYKYGSGGYQVWDPKGGVLVESRDMVFFEDGLPPPTLADVNINVKDPNLSTCDNEPFIPPQTASVPTLNTSLPPVIVQAPLTPAIIQALSPPIQAPLPMAPPVACCDKDVVLIPDYPEKLTRSGMM